MIKEVVIKRENGNIALNAGEAYSVYRRVRKALTKEFVESYCEEKGFALTEDELNDVIDDFMDAEDYRAEPDFELLSDVIYSVMDGRRE